MKEIKLKPELELGESVICEIFTDSELNEFTVEELNNYSVSLRNKKNPTFLYTTNRYRIDIIESPDEPQDHMGDTTEMEKKVDLFLDSVKAYKKYKAQVCRPDVDHAWGKEGICTLCGESKPTKECLQHFWKPDKLTNGHREVCADCGIYRSVIGQEKPHLPEKETVEYCECGKECKWCDTHLAIIEKQTEALKMWLDKIHHMQTSQKKEGNPFKVGDAVNFWQEEGQQRTGKIISDANEFGLMLVRIEYGSQATDFIAHYKQCEKFNA